MFKPYQYHSHNYMVSFNGHLLTFRHAPPISAQLTLFGSARLDGRALHIAAPVLKQKKSFCQTWLLSSCVTSRMQKKQQQKKNSVAVGSSPKKFVDTWVTFKTLIDILVFRLVHKGSLHWLIIIPNWVDLGCIIPHPFSICGAWCGNVSNASRALKALNDPGSFERWTEFVFGSSWNLEAGTLTKINMERKKNAAL